MELSNSDSGKYSNLSRHYIEMADEYLRGGDRVQASEEVCGTVAEAIKSIAKDGGWKHQSQPSSM